MSKLRRFGLDEITLRAGTYFNPQTEILVVVDDSTEVAHETFEGEDFDAAEWVLISEEAPLDEQQRDELVESFQLAHQAGADELPDESLEEDEDDLEEDEDELAGVEELDLDHE